MTGPGAVVAVSGVARAVFESAVVIRSHEASFARLGGDCHAIDATTRASVQMKMRIILNNMFVIIQRDGPVQKQFAHYRIYKKVCGGNTGVCLLQVCGAPVPLCTNEKLPGPLVAGLLKNAPVSVPEPLSFGASSISAISLLSSRECNAFVFSLRPTEGPVHLVCGSKRPLHFGVRAPACPMTPSTR